MERGHPAAPTAACNSRHILALKMGRRLTARRCAATRASQHSKTKGEKGKSRASHTYKNPAAPASERGLTTPRGGFYRARGGAKMRGHLPRAGRGTTVYGHRRRGQGWAKGAELGAPAQWLEGRLTRAGGRARKAAASGEAPPWLSGPLPPTEIS